MIRSPVVGYIVNFVATHPPSTVQFSFVLCNDEPVDADMFHSINPGEHGDMSLKPGACKWWNKPGM